MGNNSRATLSWDRIGVAREAKHEQTNWIWRRISRPRVEFDADEKSGNVPMAALQERLAACLRSSLTPALSSK